MPTKTSSPTQIGTDTTWALVHRITVDGSTYAVWKGLKEQIEHFTEQDKEITDITITYQVRPAQNKNYLKLTVKQ